jgi:hypothetical protein
MKSDQKIDLLYVALVILITVVFVGFAVVGGEVDYSREPYRTNAINAVVFLAVTFGIFGIFALVWNATSAKWRKRISNSLILIGIAGGLLLIGLSIANGDISKGVIVAIGIGVVSIAVVSAAIAIQMRVLTYLLMQFPPVQINEKGVEYAKAGQHLQAVSQFTKALAVLRDTKVPFWLNLINYMRNLLTSVRQQILINRGISNVQLERYRAALNDFETVWAENQTATILLAYNAALHFALDEKSKAIALWNQYEQLESTIDVPESLKKFEVTEPILTLVSELIRFRASTQLPQQPN